MNPPGRRCRHWALPAMILACAPPGHALAQPVAGFHHGLPDSVAADPARDAYLDETAHRLVLGARHACDTARLAIGSYTARRPPRGPGRSSRWQRSAPVHLEGQPVHLEGQPGRFGWWRSALTVYRQLRGGALGIGGLEGWTGYFVRAADSVSFHWTHGATLRFTPGNLQRSVRFLHLAVYGDWASAEGADYCAVGAGLVFMDGLLPIDLAKGLDCGRAGSSQAGCRFHPRGFTFF